MHVYGQLPLSRAYTLKGKQLSWENHISYKTYVRICAMTILNLFYIIQSEPVEILYMLKEKVGWKSMTLTC